jgi:ATP-binding cassette subfamily F protein 3
MTPPADLLILDEPTNHLDLQGIEFVEDFVQRYPGAVLVVSHDRDFLDRAVTSIVEVADGVANRFKGNFTHYAQQRDAALLALTRAHKNQREFVEKEMDFIRRNMAGQKSAQAKGRLKRLQRLQLIEKPRGSRAQMRLKFGGGKGLAGQTVVEADNLVVLAGGQKRVLDGAEFRIQYGEVVALLGRNGAGKTTLLRLIAGQGAPAAGTIRRAQTMRIGYFSQEKNDLPASGTVLDALRELDRTVDEKQLRDHLALFLFCGDDVEKPVADLSGGEKQRLSLARMTRSTFDLLCLDEPTNHLDVAGTEGLEQALKEYPGTVVIVTHDRRLVREVADRVLWLEEQKARSHPSLDACIDALHAEASRVRAEQVAAREREEKKAAATAPPPPKAADSGKIRNPLMFQRLEERIFTLEAKLKELRESMLAPENYGSGARMKDLQGQEKALEQELQDAYAQWENWQ